MLPEWIKPGVSYRWNGRRFHVRAIVDDDFVVLREWWRSKQHWNYIVEHSTFYEFAKVDDVKG